MCTSFYTLPNSGALVSPNNTKIDVQIMGYPYTKPATYLALEAVLAGASATAGASNRYLEVHIAFTLTHVIDSI